MLTAAVWRVDLLNFTHLNFSCINTKLFHRCL